MYTFERTNGADGVGKCGSHFGSTLGGFTSFANVFFGGGVDDI